MQADRLRKNTVGENAFTLVELLLVVAIIALVAGAGWGIYQGTYARLQVEGAARKLLLAARQAHITAVKNQCLCMIVFDPQGDGFATVAELPDTETREWESRILPKGRVQFADKVRVEALRVKAVYSRFRHEAAENKREITFWPEGRADAAMIQLGDGENHYSVRVCPATGKAKFFTGTVDEVPDCVIDLDAQQ